jgi:hypothetical protein
LWSLTISGRYRELCHRLKAAGKASKVALIAVVNKILEAVFYVEKQA